MQNLEQLDDCLSRVPDEVSFGTYQDFNDGDNLCGCVGNPDRHID